MPWNFPFWQVFRFLAPALMAGNVALLKHAPNVPQCALAIESLVRRAGFPRGAFQALLLEVNQIETILADERIAAVTLTGSETAGRAIGAQAGWLIKKSVLELGGSDPFIVMPSADLDLAIETAVHARCVNSGQSCIAAKRFLVADEIYDNFESLFVAGMEAVRVGDPMKKEPRSVRWQPAHDRAARRSDQRRNKTQARRVLTGGERMLGEGNYFEPTVLTDVPRTSPSIAQELFGPVAMLFRVHDLDEAIELANDTPFGLAASAWTRDPCRATALRERATVRQCLSECHGGH